MQENLLTVDIRNSHPIDTDVDRRLVTGENPSYLRQKSTATMKMQITIKDKL